MDISNVDKFIGDDVVAVVSGPRSSHGQAVDVKATRDDSEDCNELEGTRKNCYWYVVQLL